MFAGFTTSEDDLSFLLNDPVVTVKEILCDSGFNQFLKNSNQHLINFLLQDKSVDELLNICLRKQPVLNNALETNRIVRTALALLSMYLKPFQKELARSATFKRRLNEFCTAEEIDPKLCGHFQRIMESIVRYTSGDILSEIPDLKMFLVRNLNILGLRELIFFLMADYPEKFVVDAELIKMILFSEELPIENAYFSLNTISKIISSRKEIIVLFLNPEFFDKLLNMTAVLPPLSRCELFKIINKIIKWTILNPEKSDDLHLNIIRSKVDAVSNEYKLDEREIDCSSAFAAKVFTKSAAKMISIIFDFDRQNTFLNKAVLKAFCNLTKEEKVTIINESDVLNKILCFFENDHRSFKGNGHITSLIETISKIDSDMILLNNIKWFNFVASNKWNHFHGVNKTYFERNQAFNNGHSKEEGKKYKDEVKDDKDEKDEDFICFTGDDDDDDDSDSMSDDREDLLDFVQKNNIGFVYYEDEDENDNDIDDDNKNEDDEDNEDDSED